MQYQHYVDDAYRVIELQEILCLCVYLKRLFTSKMSEFGAIAAR